MKYIDLTHTITDGMPVFPGDTPVQLHATTTYKKDGFSNHSLSGNLHMGTHIDAPGHCTEQDKKVTDFALSTFIGKAVVIDARDSKEIGIDSVVDKVTEDGIVLFYTGFDKQFYRPDYFFDHPVIQPNCAEYLVAMKVKMVGLDCASVDKAPYEVHKILLTSDILIIENLTNLQQLLGYKDIELIALPLKIDGHGAPARVIARVK